MKIYISYFYQIRFFNKYLLPVSTAIWDPKWYHEFTNNQHHLFIDKNEVINGLRLPILMMPLDRYKQLGENKCDTCKKNLTNCKFMQSYYKYLQSIDFAIVMSELTAFAKKCESISCLNRLPDIVLIVHESDKCKCAERPVLVQWFKEHNIDVQEWRQIK